MTARSRMPGGGSRTRQLACERGETLIEFSLALVVFLMTLLGTAEFGIAVWQYNMMSNLAQEGARWAAVHGMNGSSPASAAQVQSYVRGRSLGLNPTVTTFLVNPTTKACTDTGTDPSALAGGSGICVRVRKTFNPLTRVIPLGALTLESTAQMIVLR
jgi:Flp pilus assembly protein TadG